MSSPKFKPHWDSARRLLERDSYELFGLSFGEVCEAVGVNVNTARAKIRRGEKLNVVMDGGKIIQRKEQGQK